MKNILFGRNSKLNIIYIIICFIIHLTIVYVAFTKIQPVSNITHHNEIQNIWDNVYIVKKDNIKEKITLPYMINSEDVGKNGFDLLVDISDIEDFNDKAIGIQMKYMDFSVRYENETIYKMSTPKNYIPKSGGGNGYFIVDIPNYVETGQISIHVIPKLNTAYVYLLNPIDIGYRSDFLVYMIQDEFFSLLSLFVLLFISIILIVISFSTKNNKTFSTKILNVGIILLDLVFYFFIKYKIIAYLFSEYRSITYFIQYFAITFMIYTAFKIAEIDVSPLFKKLCQISSQVLLLAYIVRFFLTLFGIIEMKDLYFLENIFMFYSMAIIIVTLTSSFLIDKQRIRTQEVICNIPIYILLSYIFIYHSRNKLVHLSLFVIVTIILFVYLQLRTIISEYLKILNENLHIQTYEKLINIDALTGAGSRYSLEKKLEEYRNFDSVITVMTVDVNNLKYINDNFGHIMGDEAIKSVGKYIENTIENSKVFRTGGDEYTVFCEYELEDIFLQNLNRCISLKQLDVMFSIGSCIYDPKGDISIETAIKISDNNMYKDKMRLKNIPAN